jgi:hypothetical protein
MIWVYDKDLAPTPDRRRVLGAGLAALFEVLGWRDGQWDESVRKDL